MRRTLPAGITLAGLLLATVAGTAFAECDARSPMRATETLDVGYAAALDVGTDTAYYPADVRAVTTTAAIVRLVMAAPATDVASIAPVDSRVRHELGLALALVVSFIAGFVITLRRTSHVDLTRTR